MARHDVGALLVIEAGQLCGIFSERDYARKIILQGKASRDTSVREIMTSRVFCVTPRETSEQCMALMTQARIRHLPVLEGGQVVGVISIGDVVKAMLARQQGVIEHLERYIHG
jgi:CBS domain-containing protein